MTKQEVKQKIKGKLIAVIRNEDTEFAKRVCYTITEAGIDALEVTFSVNNAQKLIYELKKELKDVLIGAGTVLNREQAQLAYENGADFIVAPCVVEEGAEYCSEKDIFCSLGAATPTEAFRAYNLGSDIVKLFPGDCIPKGMIKAIKAPMPFIELMPTGGVDDTSIKEWFDYGAYAVGIGGYLTKGISLSNLEELKTRCITLIKAKA